jgi:Protein of unknown function (DUF2934)
VVREREVHVATVGKTDTSSNVTEESASTRSDRRPAHPEPSPAEIAAEAAAIYPDTFDTLPTPEEIAAEAYAIYLARGGADGQDQDDWLEAERRLTARRQRA